MRTSHLVRSLLAVVTIVVPLGCGGDVAEAPASTMPPRDWSATERSATNSFSVAPWSVDAFEATDLAFLPDGRALLVTKGGWGGSGVGQVVLLERNGATVGTALEVPVCSDNERGLLGVAIDPRFGENGLVYLYATRDMSGCALTDPAEVPSIDAPVWNRLSAFTMIGDVIDPASERVLLDEIPGHQSTHNGGGLAFLDEDHLLVAVGEGKYGRSRDLDFVSGKVLRINVRDGVAAAGNPYSSRGGVAAYVWASGLRNPFRLAVEPASGLVAVGDVGTDVYEEVDVIVPGGDYGYPDVEGPASDDGSIEPVLWYRHSTGCISIIGATFVPSEFVPGAEHPMFVFSDLGCGGVWAADLASGTVTDLVRMVDRLDIAVSRLVYGPDDAIYATAIGSGPQPVQRIARTDGITSASSSGGG